MLQLHPPHTCELMVPVMGALQRPNPDPLQSPYTGSSLQLRTMGLDSELQPLGRGAPAAQRADQYEAVLARLHALLAGEDDFVAMMATVACELHHAFDYFDWTVSPDGWR